MLIYLDQNKWIEIAKVVNGKDRTARGVRVLTAFEEAIGAGRAAFPLSSFHYIETSRISNVDRKIRLGSAMWRLSKGATLLGYQAVVRHELEVALAKHLTQISPQEVAVIGQGHAHAFCLSPLQGELAPFEIERERSMLVGNEKLGIKPLASYTKTHRENFHQHLSTLHAQSKAVPRDLRENWLYAMSTRDILNPINEVMAKHGLSKADFDELDELKWKQVIDDMATRRVDMHLHRQVLRNPNYVSRHSDLEDWGGLALASCYCDVVICEKHMADMLRRNGFRPHARIEVDLELALAGI